MSSSDSTTACLHWNIPYIQRYLTPLCVLRVLIIILTDKICHIHNLVMQIVYSPTTSSASLSLLRAARLGFSSSLSRTTATTSLVSSSHSSSPSLIKYRSLSSFPSFRSVRPWSHGGDWRSPLSLRAQIRSAAPVIERFQRKVATMGIVCFSGLELFEWCYWLITDNWLEWLKKYTKFVFTIG